MQESKIKDLRDYAWKYFSYHADQRIKTFNFYILFVALSVGGMATLFKDAADKGYAWIVAPIAAIVSVISFIFWKLDCRNKALVRHGEAALRYLEDQEFADETDGEGGPHVLKIFARELHSTSKLPRWGPNSQADAHMTYSDCFNAVFLIFGVSGLIVAITALNWGSRPLKESLDGNRHQPNVPATESIQNPRSADPPRPSTNNHP